MRLQRRLSGPTTLPRAVALLALLAGLALTAFATRLTAAQEWTEADNAFRHRVEQVTSLVSSHFELYQSLVRAGQALFAASDDVTEDDWRRFAETVGVASHPGVTSIPFIRHIPAHRLDETLAEIRARVDADFRIDRPGERDLYCPIVYNEPAASASPPPGYDACARADPYRTMLDAHRRREVLLGGRVAIVNPRTGVERPGAVLYGPVYRDGDAEPSPYGWVALPVGIADVLDGVLVGEAPLAMRLLDGPDAAANLLYAFGDTGAGAALEHTARLRFAGRAWTMSFTHPPPRYDATIAVAAGGTMISLLLSLLLWRAGTAQARSIALADKMTVAFRESEAQRQRAEAFSLVMVTRIGLDGRWQSVPLTLGRVLGRQPARLVGAPYTDVLLPDDHAAHRQQCERLLRGDIRSFDMEQRFLHGDGRVLWLYVNWSIVTDAEGAPVQYLAYLRDISDSKRTEMALIASEEKYRNIIESLEDAYFETDLGGNLTFFNDALVRMLGYGPDELMGMNNRAYMYEEDHAPVFQAFNRLYMTGEPRRGMQWRVRAKDGASRYVEASMSLMHDAAGQPVGFRGIARDITERREADARIHHLAHYDALTGLPNRTLFEDRLRQVLRRRWRNRQRAALLFLDLDRFKTVNDSLGHHAGDMLLQAVSERIKRCVRAGDTVCRPGGDEFLVLLADLAEPVDAANVAEKVLAAVAEPYTIEGWEFSITPSVGIAVIPDDGNDIEKIVRNADAAMYHAKEGGGNHFQFFTAEMTEGAADRLSLEHGLRRALERDELELYYQPLVDVRDGRIIGAEALLRWNRPDHGVVAAGEFIGVVEQSGLMLGIGEWVLARACRQAQAWHERLGQPLPIAVNLSALQFRQHGLVEMITGALDDAKLAPACLEIELTESVVMQDAALTIETVCRLREYGVHFAIDDFGTGYSSLSYLKRFPIDRVKIDRSFVRDLTHDPDDTALINAIISMAHSLRLEVIAEGVETAEQMAYLYRQDCFLMQGYLFSRPVPAAEFERLLDQGVIHP